MKEYELKIFRQPDEYEIKAKNRIEAMKKQEIIINQYYPDYSEIYKIKLKEKRDY